jgi:hypothetical protein
MRRKLQQSATVAATIAFLSVQAMLIPGACTCCRTAEATVHGSGESSACCSVLSPEVEARTIAPCHAQSPASGELGTLLEHCCCMQSDDFSVVANLVILPAASEVESFQSVSTPADLVHRDDFLSRERTPDSSSEPITRPATNVPVYLLHRSLLI